MAEAARRLCRDDESTRDIHRAWLVSGARRQGLVGSDVWWVCCAGGSRLLTIGSKTGRECIRNRCERVKILIGTGCNQAAERVDLHHIKPSAF